MAGMRTKKGNVTQEAREKHGDRKGSFPIFDGKSCRAAVKLRHHGKGVSASSVLDRAAAWARKHGDKG